MVERALADGQPPSAFRGRFRRFLDKQALKDGGTIRVYGEFIFVFKRGVLITTFRMPNEFRKLVKGKGT